jgi:hypothetical protein
MPVRGFFVSLRLMEYRIIKGARILILVLSILVFIMGAGCIGSVVFSSIPEKGDGATIGIGLFLAVLAVFICLEGLKTRLTIDGQAIRQRSLVISRSLPLNEIKGYRHWANGRLRLMPKNPGYKMVEISVYLERRAELLAWVKERYPDLDAAEYETATKNIFSDEQYGISESERLQYLRKAKWVANAGNTVGLASIIWAWLSPQPYEWALFTGLALPWICVFVVWLFKGMIRFDARRGNPYPSISGLIFLPVFGVLIRALTDYHVYDPRQVWVPVLATAAFCTLAFLYICAKALADVRRKWVSWLVIFFVACGYSYTLVLFTNNYFNIAPPREFLVTVQEKHLTEGKTTSYYLTLDAWGRFAAGEDVDVSRALYQSVQEGQRVHVYLFDGKWNIPCYVVTH